MPFEDLAFLFTCGWENRGICRLNFDEAALLYKTVRELDDPKGVEIGRYLGGSTVLLADAVGPRGYVESIDVNGRHVQNTRGRLEGLGLLSRVDLIVGDSKQIPTPIHGLDFVFIDGDHKYEGVKADQERWGAAVRPGGLVIHHDMTSSRPPGKHGPQRVFHEMMEGDEFRRVSQAASLVVFVKEG